MPDTDPADVIKQLREDLLDCTQGLALKKLNQKELNTRITELEKLLGEIGKIFEAYKKQHPTLAKDQHDLECFHDTLSDPPEWVQKCVDSVTKDVDFKIKTLSGALKDARAQRNSAADTVARLNTTFESLKATLSTNSELISELMDRMQELSKAKCKQATLYFLKTEFKLCLKKLKQALISPAQLWAGLTANWTDLQKAKNALAARESRVLKAKHELSDYLQKGGEPLDDATLEDEEKLCDAIRQARDRIIRARIETECTTEPIERSEPDETEEGGESST